MHTNFSTMWFLIFLGAVSLCEGHVIPRSISGQTSVFNWLKQTCDVVEVQCPKPPCTTDLLIELKAILNETNVFGVHLMNEDELMPFGFEASIREYSDHITKRVQFSNLKGQQLVPQAAFWSAVEFTRLAHLMEKAARVNERGNYSKLTSDMRDFTCHLKFLLTSYNYPVAASVNSLEANFEERPAWFRRDCVGPDGEFLTECLDRDIVILKYLRRYLKMLYYLVHYLHEIEKANPLSAI